MANPIPRYAPTKPTTLSGVFDQLKKIAYTLRDWKTIFTVSPTSVTIANHVVLAQENDAVTPTLSFGDGDTGLYEAADDVLSIGIGAGGRRFYFNGGGYYANSAGGGLFLDVPSSATAPVFIPRSGDTDSGLGAFADDNPSLVAGGLEAIRAEDPADLAAGETSLWLYDLDNGAIQQVTVGAADSGGSGYKVLRIPN